MIITASRRTDIPAFYSEWFMNRIRAGYVLVPNPFYPESVSKIPLSPDEVSAIIFCTKNPEPMLKHLPELDRFGYRSIFQVTLTGYPSYIEPRVPETKRVIEIMKRLADKLGPERVIWRFDPVLITSETPEEKIIEKFKGLARELKGSTERVIISFTTFYKKVLGRFGSAEEQRGIKFIDVRNDPECAGRISSILAGVSEEYSLAIQSCSSPTDLSGFGISKGSCVDSELLNRIFGLKVKNAKAKSQRKDCGCAESRDLGQYDSCPHGCIYCYAVSTRSAAVANYKRHDPNSPQLLDTKKLYRRTKSIPTTREYVGINQTTACK